MGVLNDILFIIYKNEGWSYYGAASFSVMELLSEDSPDLFSNIKFHQLIGLFLFLCGKYVLI